MSAPVGALWQEISIAGQRMGLYCTSDHDNALDSAIANDKVAPYGVVVWNSALALVERWDVSPELHIVDVGSGCGLLSLFAAKAGHSVTALDHCEASLELLRASAERHGIVGATSFHVQHFDIGSLDPLPEGDVYVFADVLYERSLVPIVVRRIEELIARKKNVLVVEPQRSFQREFEALLRAEGVEVKRVSLSSAAAPSEEVSLYSWSPE